MKRVLCVGEMMVDLIAYPIGNVRLESDYHPMDSFLVTAGGDAHNNAVDLARLGNEVTYVGCIGNDLFAQVCLHSLQNSGINVDHVVFSQTAQQSKTLLLMGESRGRTFYQNFGSSEEFCFSDINLRLLDHVDALQIGGTFHMRNFDGEGAVKLLKAAKEKHVLTSLDVTMDRHGRWNSLLEPYYAYLDYFMPSIDQAKEIAGTNDLKQMALFFINRGVKNVIIKIGEKGSYFLNRSLAFTCPCYSVPVADATGAGDAYVSGFLTGVMQGFSPEKCAVLATACSAHVVQAVGATAGMQDMKTILTFIHNNKELKIVYD